MRDAARAAAMSDPTENRWFRRRWVEDSAAWCGLPAGPVQEQAVVPLLDTMVTSDRGLELLGQELLAAWRRERTAMGGRRDA